MTTRTVPLTLPGGNVGDCLLALGAIGRPASTREVRLWLEAQGELLTLEQVRGCLKYLARRRVPPMVEALGVSAIDSATVWKLTEAADALLAAEDGE